MDNELSPTKFYLFGLMVVKSDSGTIAGYFSFGNLSQVPTAFRHSFFARKIKIIINDL